MYRCANRRFGTHHVAERAMAGPTATAGMDYALRLTERYDGRATHIDGSYLATSRPDLEEGGPQVTRNTRQALRFRGADAAAQFCADGRAARLPAGDGGLTELIRTYAIDVVAVRRPATPTGAATAGRPA
jgi:hypothetical protein